MLNPPCKRRHIQLKRKKVVHPSSLGFATPRKGGIPWILGGDQVGGLYLCGGLFGPLQVDVLITFICLQYQCTLSTFCLLLLDRERCGPCVHCSDHQPSVLSLSYSHFHIHFHIHFCGRADQVFQRIMFVTVRSLFESWPGFLAYPFARFVISRPSSHPLCARMFQLLSERSAALRVHW